MVTINIAYTSPINPNPSGPEPTLSQRQVWAGLKRKARRAQDFVPVIVACEVLLEDDVEGKERVLRKVQFAGPPGSQPSAPIEETCVHYPPSRVDYEQENGSTISNIVSTNPAGELLMTFSFEWKHPDIEEGSAKATELEKSHWKVGHTQEEGQDAPHQNLRYKVQ